MITSNIMFLSKVNLFVYTFPMGLCFDDLTDASWPHCILRCECELVPGSTLEVLQPIGALTGTDGKVTPLLAVILRVLQNVAWKRTRGEMTVKEQEKQQGTKTLKKKNRVLSVWPLMELPPLSPGIQERVIEVVVVLVTVRRGWSGGTEGKAQKLVIVRARKKINSNPQVQQAHNITCV